MNLDIGMCMHIHLYCDASLSSLLELKCWDPSLSFPLSLSGVWRQSLHAHAPENKQQSSLKNPLQNVSRQTFVRFLSESITIESDRLHWTRGRHVQVALISGMRVTMEMHTGWRNRRVGIYPGIQIYDYRSEAITIENEGAHWTQGLYLGYHHSLSARCDDNRDWTKKSMFKCI